MQPLAIVANFAIVASGRSGTCPIAGAYKYDLGSATFGTFGFYCDTSNFGIRAVRVDVLTTAT